MKHFFGSFRLGVHAQFIAGLCCLTLSAVLLATHAGAVRAMSEIGLPAAIELPLLEQRMQILKEQNEVAELQVALATGSSQEMLNVYVLPSEVDSVRPLATFDVLVSYLQKKKQLMYISAITVGDVQKESESLIYKPLTFTAHVTRDGWKNMLLFTKLSGLMTIGDALGESEFTNLLSLTEQENPATVAALEQFFSVDLLRYVQEPRPFNDAFLKSFSSDTTLQAVRAFIDGPRLQSIRELLDPMAPTLRANRLWPLPFMDIQTVDQRLREDGTFEVTVTVLVYGRTNR